MNLLAFAKLSIDERADHLHFKGTFTASRNFVGHIISLYSLEGFFFELWFSPSQNEIVKIQPIPDKEDIKLYTEQTDLLKLFYADE